MKRRIFIPLLLVGWVLLACRAVPLGLSATPTRMPSEAPLPTDTLIPSPPDLPTRTPTPAPTATLAAFTQTATSQPVVLKDQTIQEEDKTRLYTIQLLYPLLDASAPQAVKFNAGMQREVDAVVAQFKKDAADASSFPSDVTTGSYLEMKYQLFYARDGLMSIQLQISFYMKGAAHPNSYTIAFNYDMKADRELVLADLFRPQSGHLEVIAAACLADLQKRDLPLFTEGADPIAENYRSWNITPQGLRITFDPYQVVAYAAGPQVVTLPWPNLAGLLDPSLALPAGSR